MNDSTPSGGTPANLLAALAQRRTDDVAAAAEQHAADAALYWRAARAIAGLDIEAPAVDELDAALRRLGVDIVALRGDGDALKRLRHLASLDHDEVARRLDAARTARDEALAKAAALRAEADATEKRAAAAVRAADDLVARAAAAQSEAERLAAALARRGCPLAEDDAPSAPPAPRPLRFVRTLVDCFIDGKPRKVGETFVSDARLRDGVLEAVERPAPQRPEWIGGDPTTIRRGDDRSVDQRDWPMSTEGWRARQDGLAQIAAAETAADGEAAEDTADADGVDEPEQVAADPTATAAAEALARAEVRP